MFLSAAALYAITFRGAAEGGMVQRVSTVAFEGIDARAVDVQVQVAPGLPAFAIVGLPDKAVSEARERVRSALIASGLALPARRITVNLARADLPKEGSHYDLPIALGLMAAIGAIPPDALSGPPQGNQSAFDGQSAFLQVLRGSQALRGNRNHRRQSVLRAMMQLLQQQSLPSPGSLDIPYRGDHDQSVGGRMRT